MRIVNHVSADAVDASTSFNGSPVLLEQFYGYSVQVIITGTVTGSLKLQGSDDFRVPSMNDPTGVNVVNWTDITGSTQSISGSGNGIYNSPSCQFRWIRPVYTAVSGTGTMTINVEGKGA